MTFRLLLLSELRSGLRTFRFTALVLAAVFFGLTDPLFTRFMPELLGLFAGEITIIMPAMTAQDAMATFFGDVGQILGFVMVAVTMGSIARERERGVAGWLLTMPVGKRTYLGVKLAAMVAGVVAAITAGTIIAWAYTASLFGYAPGIGTILSAAGVILVLVMVGTITVVASALWRNQLVAGAAGFVTLLGTWASGLLAGTGIGRYLPVALLQAKSITAGAESVGDLIPAMAVTAAITFGIAMYGSRRFERTET